MNFPEEHQKDTLFFKQLCSLMSCLLCDEAGEGILLFFFEKFICFSGFAY